MAYSGSLGIRNSLDGEMDQFYILLVAFHWTFIINGAGTIRSQKPACINLRNI